MRRYSVVVAMLLAALTSQQGSAGVFDYEVVTETSDNNSDDLKSLVVDCPAGKLPLGGGSRIFGFYEGIALLSSGPNTPSGTATGWHGVAHEVIAQSRSWSLRVYVICGEVDGYQFFAEATGSNSDSLKFLEVHCPVGKQLLGGGSRIFGSTDGTALSTSLTDGPPGAPTAWLGVATEVLATSSSWGLRVDAICGEVDGYQVITESTDSNRDYQKLLLVDCPAGKQLLGGGSRIFGSLNGIALSSSGPEGPSDAPTGWHGFATDLLRTNSLWGLRVDAICAPEPSSTLLGVTALGLLGLLRRAPRRPPSR